jgi:hypothetical protein
MNKLSAIIFVIIIFGMLMSVIFANTVVVYAQNAAQSPEASQSPQSSITKPNGTTTPLAKVAATTTAIPTTLAIKITSPTKEQQIPVGGRLTVSGISTDDATTNCRVSIILNDIKPYQDAIPMGTNGENDYSKWSYTLTHHYAVIKEGINKITAKLSCVDDPAKSKWYSANVTGVNRNNQQIP